MQRRSISLIIAFIFLAFSSNAQNTQNLEKLAYEKLAAGDLEGAVTDFSRVIDQLTLIGKRKSDRDAFAPLNDEVRVVEPAAANAYLGRGRAYVAMRRLDAALIDFDRAIKVAPAEPAGYFLRATVRLTLKQHRLAMEDYDQAIMLDPKHAPS